MFGKRFHLLTVLGFPIRVDASWFVVVVLVGWSLSRTFPLRHPALTPSQAWAAGLTAALGLFVSVLLHELAHAVTARAWGLPIRGITLFIFGGVAEMENEPERPGTEFAVAIAGPIASTGIALLAVFGQAVATLLGWPPAVLSILMFLGFANFGLVVFNIVPAFPLDGGRVLRSLLWRLRGDLDWATRVSSGIGRAFGLGLVGLGVLRAVAADDVAGGLWIGLIGIFLHSAARLAYRQATIRAALTGESITGLMRSDPVTVPRSASVEETARRYFSSEPLPLLPVVDEGNLLGCVTANGVRGLPRGEWARQSVGTIVESCSVDNTVAPGSDVMSALATMSRTGIGGLMVAEAGRLVGVIAIGDVLQFLHQGLSEEPTGRP